MSKGAVLPVTFSSDYGLRDEYVGVCHLVMSRIAPAISVMDLAHGLEGIRAGSVVLAQALPFAPVGVHLAVVDPGVGTPRRGVVMVTGSGSKLVGPDNGLLPPAGDALGGIQEAFELAEASFQIEPVSQTFHGRDVFAPATAHLALGTAPAEFGPRVEAGDLVRLDPALVISSPGRLVSDVARFDHYGNIQLAARASDLATAGLSGVVRVETDSSSIDAVVGRRFADADPGGLVVYVDSGGSVAVARRDSSARELLSSPGQLTVSRKA